MLTDGQLDNGQTVGQPENMPLPPIGGDGLDGGIKMYGSRPTCAISLFSEMLLSEVGAVIFDPRSNLNLESVLSNIITLQ